MSKHGRVITFVNLELKYINRTESITTPNIKSTGDRLSIIQGLRDCKNVSSTLPITQFGLNNRKKSKGRLNLKAILFTEDTLPNVNIDNGCGM